MDLIRHMITAGFRGVVRVLDPLRRYFSAEFSAAMAEHARTEFPLLARPPRRGSPDILIKAADR